MKTATLIAAATAALLSANLAGADTGTGNTRDDVLAELALARSTGELATKISEDSAAFLYPGNVSTLTRADVLTDLELARLDGRLKAINNNDNTPYLRGDYIAFMQPRYDVVAQYIGPGGHRIEPRLGYANDLAPAMP